MDNKFERVLEAIIDKTESGNILWKRTDTELYRTNPFYSQYIRDNDMGIDGINNYSASYGEGYIYFTNQVEDGYRELAVQPNKTACVSVLATGRVPKLTVLEDKIKNKLDNTDDFIDSIIN